MSWWVWGGQRKKRKKHKKKTQRVGRALLPTGVVGVEKGQKKAFGKDQGVCCGPEPSNWERKKGRGVRVKTSIVPEEHLNSIGATKTITSVVVIRKL